MKKISVKEIVLYLLALSVLGLVFSAYTSPSLMVTFADLMYSCF